MYTGRGAGGGMELHYTKLASEFFFLSDIEQIVMHPNNRIKLLSDDE